MRSAVWLPPRMRRSASRSRQKPRAVDRDGVTRFRLAKMSKVGPAYTPSTYRGTVAPSSIDRTPTTAAIPHSRSRPTLNKSAGAQRFTVAGAVRVHSARRPGAASRSRARRRRGQLPSPLRWPLCARYCSHAGGRARLHLESDRKGPAHCNTLLRVTGIGCRQHGSASPCCEKRSLAGGRRLASGRSVFRRYVAADWTVMGRDEIFWTFACGGTGTVSSS